MVTSSYGIMIWFCLVITDSIHSSVKYKAAFEFKTQKSHFILGLQNTAMKLNILSWHNKRQYLNLGSDEQNMGEYH